MITLIRHTTPDVEKGICYGQTDLKLSSSYNKELEEIESKIHIKDQKIYSSPLKRCTTLARDLFSEYNTDDRLMELNFGDWELQKWDNINDEYAQKWFNDYINESPPNGESLMQMHNRVKSFYNDIIKDNNNTDYIIVTHAGVIRCLNLIMNNYALSCFFDIKPKYGEIFIYEF